LKALLNFGTEVSSDGRGVVFPPRYATPNPPRIPLSWYDDDPDGKIAEFRHCGRAAWRISFWGALRLFL